MRYISTRGKSDSSDFESVLLSGLASDGGLYVPETLPRFTLEQMHSWAGMDYHDLAFEVIYPFVANSIEEEVLRAALQESYDAFTHPAVAPLRQVEANEWILELFHGPTLAFKDFALQLLGRLLGQIMERRGERAAILGATSGDTGSAAIDGCRHCKNADIYILHPYGRVSEVQRRQMTTVLDENVHNVAIEGDFDDCQELVKASFQNRTFLKDRRLVAVNSINWTRIMAQTVYYFHAAIQLGAPARSVAFSVPTGNFGDIYAGYLARNMGLPISQLIVATNRNDILHRFISGNHYNKRALNPTMSPAMDIMVSSNFERLLFDMHGRQGSVVDAMMRSFRERKTLSVAAERWMETRKLFDSFAVDDAQTCQTITDIHAQTGEIIDPHTAVALCAARRCRREPRTPMVVLGTAHPAKFAHEMKTRIPGIAPATHHQIDHLHALPERCTVLRNDLGELQTFIHAH